MFLAQNIMEKKIKAVINGIGGYVPEAILDNEELSRMVDTSDEWIMSRIGIKTRHVLGERRGSAYMGIKAVQDLIDKTSLDTKDVDLLICCTTTPSFVFPSNASLICGALGITSAYGYDLAAACSGFIFGLDTCATMIESGKYKKIILVCSEKMTAITNYEDRNTCPLFGDGAAAVLIEPTTEDVGVVDSILRIDGLGKENLHLKAGGSLHPASIETVTNKEHYIYQEGQAVFKRAVSDMSAVAEEIMIKNALTSDDIAWLVPHQANIRIIEAVAKRMSLPREKTLINIEHYGNTSAASIPLCLWDYESRLRKGDILVLAAFGAGFSWGSVLLKWGYDIEQSKKM